MLRAGVKDPTNPIALVGLTEENVARLKAGHPIRAALSSFVPEMPGTLTIIYGKTHGELGTMLRSNGLIDEKTEGLSDPLMEQQEEAARRHPRILIATVGLPRAGKTTWAQSQAYPIVCPDAIRLALHGERFLGPAEPMVWVLAKYMVKALFGAGHGKVILNATNTTRKRRDEWVGQEWATFFKHIDTDAATCRERAAGDPAILPVIDRMAGEFQPLGPDERPW